MKKILLSVLLLSSAALAQTCQVLSGPLLTRTPAIGGTGACDAGSQTSVAGNVVTFTDVYHDTVVGSSKSTSPGQVWLDQTSPPLSANGACYYQPPDVNPRTGQILAPAVSVDCLPISNNNITAATSVTDFNRFIAQMYPQTVDTSPCPDCIFGHPTGACNKGPFVQNLVQWPGIMCQPPPGGGNAGPCTPNPDNPYSQIPINQGPVGSLGVKILNTGPDTPPPCDVSPIVIDLTGEGFHLTSAENGVTFDIRGNGYPIKMAWTALGSHNAFLALDRDGTGTITSGKELFGNFTAQPASAHPNGFLALAEFDKPENGGNGDGVIDNNDAIFAKLRLWVDLNHDGIAQKDEVHTLRSLGVFSISLKYRDSRRVDEFGNMFRYEAVVNGERKHEDSLADEVGRHAYDVFFVTK